MKIREHTSGQLLTVYGLYWSGDLCYFCCFPKNSMGLSTYTEQEIDIVDTSVDAGFEFKRLSDRMSGVFHSLLLRDNLLADLFEHDPEAHRKFSALIGFQP